MDKKDKFPHNPEVEAFKQNILKTAEDMVVNKFPQRIIQLNKMLSSGKLTSKPSSVYQKINVPVPDVSDRDSNSNTSQTTAAASSTGQATTGSASQSSGRQVGASNGEAGVSINHFEDSSIMSS